MVEYHATNFIIYLPLVNGNLFDPSTGNLVQIFQRNLTGRKQHGINQNPPNLMRVALRSYK
jgi:hypothetical protein